MARFICCVVTTNVMVFRAQYTVGPSLYNGLNSHHHQRSHCSRVIFRTGGLTYTVTVKNVPGKNVPKQSVSAYDISEQYVSGYNI